MSTMEDDAVAALAELLKRESDPLFVDGRSYFSHLARWRDHIAVQTEIQSRERAHCSESLARDSSSAVTAKNEDSVVATPSGGCSDGREDECARASFWDKNRRVCFYKVKLTDEPIGSSGVGGVMRPDCQPNTLIGWRKWMVDHVFNVADSMGYDRNIALVALCYLDIYAMKTCFPSDSAMPTDSTEEVIHGMKRQQYALAAVASFFIASKVFPRKPVTSQYVAALWGGYFSAQQVEYAESVLLNVLGFQVNPPTPSRFIQELLPLLIPYEAEDETKFADGTFGSIKWELRSEFQKGVVAYANFLVENLAHSTYFPYVASASPSKIALASIVVAVKVNKHLATKQSLLDSFNDRVLGLCNLAPDGDECEEVFNEFRYDDEVKHIQTTLEHLCYLSQDKIFAPEDQAIDSSISPVTVVASTEDPSFYHSSKGAATEGSKISSKRKRCETSPCTTAATTSRRYKLRKACPGGKGHRVWERADKCKEESTSRRTDLSTDLTAALQSAIFGGKPREPSSSAVAAATSTVAAIANFASNAHGSKAKASKCPGGRNHRTWERTDKCALAATSSRSSLPSDLLADLNNVSAITVKTNIEHSSESVETMYCKRF